MIYVRGKVSQTLKIFQNELHFWVSNYSEIWKFNLLKLEAMYTDNENTSGFLFDSVFQ